MNFILTASLAEIGKWSKCVSMVPLAWIVPRQVPSLDSISGSRLWDYPTFSKIRRQPIDFLLADSGPRLIRFYPKLTYTTLGILKMASAM